MVITNGLVFRDDGFFAQSDISVQDGLIEQVGPAGSMSREHSIDAAGGYVLPGFVDIHTHGAAGHDFSDGEAKGVEEMLYYFGIAGVTSVVPTTVPVGDAALDGAIETLRGFFDADGYGAVLRGVHLEGPFVNPDKRGALNPEFIETPDLELFEKLYERADGQVRLVSLAPELPGSLDFIRAVSRRCTVSVAHTLADYAAGVAAFQAGATHVTHLFCAMPPFLHRDPGVIGAASDFADHVEVISDGVHLHPAVVRAVFKWFGPERVCLVSDSMRATGMPDGPYPLGGLAATKEGNRATLPDGTIAGSVTNLAECARKAVQFGVPMEHVIRAATINPAKAVGLDSKVGSLSPGKRADILIWNRDLQPYLVMSGGEIVLD